MITTDALELGDWVTHGACGDADPDLFFPSTSAQAAQAIAICRRCPVMMQCRAYARAAGEDAGIWGGERQEDRARATRPQAGLRTLVCVECGATFEAPDARHKICSTACRETRRHRQITAANHRRGRARAA